MAWQIATASASAAWSGRGSSASPSSASTIRATWSFSRAAAAADGALDLLGGVAGARHAALAGREHHHAARLPDREGAARVLAEVELLERDRVGLVLGEQRLERRVDLGQAPLVRRRRARVSMTPPSSATQAPAAARDDAVAGVGEAGVDAEDDHGHVILRPAPDACLAVRCALPQVTAASSIDFEAEGLLDGLEGEQRAERLALLEQLAAEGVPLTELRRATGDGTLHVPARRPRDRRRASATRPPRSPS